MKPSLPLGPSGPGGPQSPGGPGSGMSPLAGLPGAPMRPGGPGLPGEAHVPLLASSQLKCLELVLGKVKNMLLLTWGSWEAFFSRKAWGRNSWAPRVTSLSLSPRYSHGPRRTHFMQTLMIKNSASIASMNLFLSPEKDPPLSRSTAEEVVGSAQGPNSGCNNALVPEPHFLLMTYHTDQPQVCFLLGLCPTF